MSELYARIYVLVAQSCLSLCDPMDCSPPGSSVHGILQAISFSGGSSWWMDWTQFSCIAGRIFTIWVTGKSQNIRPVLILSLNILFDNIFLDWGIYQTLSTLFFGFKYLRCFYLFIILFYIGVSLISSVVLVSGVQHSHAVIHTHVSILFQNFFPFRLLQNIKQSSLCYKVSYCGICVLKVIILCTL